MKSSPRPSNQLSLAKREIQLKEQDLQRKMEEARKRLESAPERIKKEKEKQRTLQRIEATTTASAEYYTRVRHQRGRDVGGGREMRRSLRAHQREGKIKFLILCMVFVIILVLLWQSMPG
jgi:hypothetical protein